MIADFAWAPPRLAPFLAQWDYMAAQLLGRLTGLTDTEYLWEPAPGSWTVAPLPDGRGAPEERGWAVDAVVTPPRTLAWSICHLGSGTLVRADHLTGGHTLQDEDVDWPMPAAAGIELLRRGLHAWRGGLAGMTDMDLDTIGRSAYPHGLDPTLPLLDIVWWVNKELIEHAAEIWFVRDLYAATQQG